MKRSPQPSGQQPDKVQPDAVQGEGDYKSAESYGQAVRSFVQSGQVEDAARKATPATLQEQEEQLKAERTGLSHSKGEDPASPFSPARKPVGGERGKLGLRRPGL